MGGALYRRYLIQPPAGAVHFGLCRRAGPSCCRGSLARGPERHGARRRQGADSAGGIEMKGETLSLDRCIEIALRKPDYPRGVPRGECRPKPGGPGTVGVLSPDRRLSGLQQVFPVDRPDERRPRPICATATTYPEYLRFRQDLDPGDDPAAEPRRPPGRPPNTTSQIVLNVKRAYYGLLQAGKTAMCSTVAQFEQHLNQAKRFLRARRQIQI